MQAGEGGLRGGRGKIRKGILATYQRGTQHATDLVAKVGNLSWAKGNMESTPANLTEPVDIDQDNGRG